MRTHTLELLRSISTATLTTQLFKKGFRQQFLVNVRPLNDTAASFAGPAYTMRFIPAREDLETLESVRDREGNLQWRAVEEIPPGHVLVVDSREDVRAATAGDMLLTRLAVRGAAGVVTDGAFRDGPVIAKMAIPAYARAMTASTRLSCFHVADLQCPIGCAGVAVYPGDIVVGDREGVVVIPHEHAEEIAQEGSGQEDLERYLHVLVRDGAPLWGTYPPDDATLAKYRNQKPDGGSTR